MLMIFFEDDYIKAMVQHHFFFTVIYNHFKFLMV